MTNSGNWYVLNDGLKIKNVIGKLLSRKTEITIKIKNDRDLYTSKVIKIDHEDGSSESGTGSQIIIDKVMPDVGNSIIQSLPEVTLEFPFDRNQCRCSVNYTGISSEFPYYGIILSFPESIEFTDKRREERYVFDMPDMVSVEFRLNKDPNKVYSMSVYDSSPHGLGILVTERDMDILEILNPGDEIKDITFYATSAMIKVDGVVRHKTLLKEGRYRDCYILGVESPDIIESYKPPRSEDILIS